MLQAGINVFLDGGWSHNDDKADDNDDYDDDDDTVETLLAAKTVLGSICS